MAIPKDICQGHGCPQCKKNKLKNTFIWTNEQFLEKLSEVRNDVEILEEYKGSQQNIKCRCKKCGKDWFVAPCRLLKNVKCFYCSHKDRSGENSCMWNPNLTDEERAERRKNPIYKQFTEDIMKRDNYTCQLTGDRNSRHNVHHLNGFDKFIEQRLDKCNAITLSEDIHKEFHQLYGYGDNTKERFYEFVDILYLQGRITKERYNNFVKNFKQFIITEGAQELSLTSGGISTASLNGSALATYSGNGGCSNGGYYAIITEHIYGKSVWDNVVSLAVYDSDIDLASAETQTIAVYAIYSDGTVPSKIDNSYLTFTSSNDAVATVTSAGVVTATGVGTANIEIVATDNTNLSAYAVVTVS